MHDLSWFVEAVGLEFAARGWSDRREWLDSAGNALSLARLIRAHFLIVEQNHQRGGFLPEQGVHGSSATLRVIRSMKLTANFAPELERHQRLAISLLESLALRLAQQRNLDAEGSQVAAHILEIALCPGNEDPLSVNASNKPATRVRTETLDNLANSVADYVSPSDSSSPQLDSHALRGLTFYLAFRGSKHWRARALRLSCSVI
jgi:hypothetical protein